MLRATEDAVSFAVSEGLQVMYVTEDTTAGVLAGLAAGRTFDPAILAAMQARPSLADRSAAAA